ncbi:MAG: VWA domain-containing protein, partial [Pseudomonadota bacterium]
IKEIGGWDKLMETLRQRLEEQRKRHEGGSKWIGTGGTSPFGAYGYNPSGVRIGQDGSRPRRAAKVWDRREFRNLDSSVELGTRNIKMALRRLRRFAREGAAEQLDIDDTIASTARNAGFLDLRMVPERHNAVKVLLFLDVGGSMDDHVRVCEELFSATRAEFKHLEYFYFHNFVYESVWQDNRRRHAQRIPLTEVMRTYGRDYKLVMVGDATMSPYEISYPGGSVEHWNEEPGAVWIARLLRVFPYHIWLNPEPRQRWEHTPSIGMTRELVGDRMFPMTLQGLDAGIAALRDKALV